MSWSRFGPTVPVVPASFRVWQPAHFFWKICLPFVPLINCDSANPERPAFAATNAATSSASWPRRRLAGMFALRKLELFCAVSYWPGYLICSWTMFRIALSLYPSARA